MVTIAAALTMVFHSPHFPLVPISAELLRGERVFMEGSGIERTMQEDRQAIGVWFDGHRKREVEDAIYLSPAMVSRWLGYLRAREKWEPTTLADRWNEARRELEGTLTVLVKVASFEKQDPLDFGDSPPGQLAAVSDLRFVATVQRPLAWGETARIGRARFDERNGNPIASEPTSQLRDLYAIQPTVRPLTVRQAYEWSDLIDLPWSQIVPFRQVFLTEFEDQLPEEGLPLGDNFEAFYLVQIPISPITSGARTFQVRVLSATKERVAEFSLRTETVK